MVPDHLVRAAPPPLLPRGLGVQQLTRVSVHCLPTYPLGALQEASIAWEKRQAEVRAKVQQESDANAWATWWDNVAGEVMCVVFFSSLWLTQAAGSLAWHAQDLWEVVCPQKALLQDA